MLLIKAKTGPSTIAGTGLFAEELIPKGALVWRFSKDVDSAEPFDIKKQNLFYSYISKQTGRCITPGDISKHINHSDTPNLITHYQEGVEEDMQTAAKDIAAGEELTADYRTFAQEGVDFKN
ncbi:MAG TPA: SET domain-containing protein [Candidatus Paceibacterota bacterium]|nr:SET domain-containing protein [Candidatus Paceibacterota bacterium]